MVIVDLRSIEIFNDIISATECHFWKTGLVSTNGPWAKLTLLVLRKTNRPLTVLAYVDLFAIKEMQIKGVGSEEGSLPRFPWNL